MYILLKLSVHLIHLSYSLRKDLVEEKSPPAPPPLLLDIKP